MTAKGAIVIVAAALLLPLAGGCGPRVPSDPLQAQAWEHGVEILGVQLMADGQFARLNYRVVDYRKAKQALKGEVELLATGTGQPLPVASAGKLGPLRQRPSSTGRAQFMLFTNFAHTLRKGDSAVLRIGEKQISGIPVT